MRRSERSDGSHAVNHPAVLPAAISHSQAEAQSVDTAGPPETHARGRRPRTKSRGAKLSALVSKIHAATRGLNLSREQYSVLFEALAEEINSNGYDADETSLFAFYRHPSSGCHFKEFER